MRLVLNISCYVYLKKQVLIQTKNENNNLMKQNYLEIVQTHLLIHLSAYM